MIKHLAIAGSLVVLAGCALPPATAQVSTTAQSSEAVDKELYTGSRIPVKVPQRPLAEIDRHTFDEFRQNQRAAGAP